MQPTMTRLSHTRYAFDGPFAAYLHAITEQWLLIAPAANPAILDMFADRDRKPYRDQVPGPGNLLANT